MSVQKLNQLTTLFNFIKMGSVFKFMYRKLVLFVGAFWFSVSSYLLPLFSFISRYSFSLVNNRSNSKSVSISVETSTAGTNLIESEPESEAEPDFVDSEDSEKEGVVEKEEPKLCFKFSFPRYEEFSRSRREGGDFVSLEDSPSTSKITKYEFMSGKSFTRFLEELEAESSKVEEVNTDANIDSFGHKVEGVMQVEEELPENLTTDVGGEEVAEKIETVEEQKEQEATDDTVFDEIQVPAGKDDSPVDSDTESGTSDHLHSVINRLADSFNDGFLSDGDFGGDYELNALMDIAANELDSHQEMSDSEEDQKSGDVDEEDSDIMNELRNLEESDLGNSDAFKTDFLSEENFGREGYKSRYGEFSGKDDDNKPIKDSADSEKKPESKNSCDLESENTNKLESLWEHQELIEQLKMELKKVRATGLPTILEESEESPKIMEDLKPWKIDEKFHREDRMTELHKFYKSYRERMRKFDILNYQKMYAIGFMQLKDPHQSVSTQTSSVPEITTLLSRNLSLVKKRKKQESDPMMKFVKELQSELEVVYVGQMCLSWEILQWQYEKALDLWESDPRGIRRYNVVAGEFQQFQVLIQRFLEDEPFQGPRVQNYVKNRCVLRNLLQAPVIREDSTTKDRKKAGSGKGGYAITSDLLVEIMEETIRIFWRFVRADKDCSSTDGIVTVRKGPSIELQNPADSELFMEIRKNLQKKEKKLKDLFRSGNCILRRFQKCREDDTNDQVLYFFSQVDLTLVSRVLNMSRITSEQLVWCRNKLSKISFVKRKIHVEPSFLLFPC